MKILNAAEAFDKSAEIYQNKSMDVSLFAETFNFFCDNISDDNASILDIACGPGNITRYLLDRKPNYDMLGVDLAPKMLELAQANNPTAKFELMDCREIRQIEKRFDGIVCGFCLPYLTHEETIELIADTSSLLKPGGLFYLSTMEENDESKSRYQISSTGDQVYVNYHQGEFLSKTFSEHNFKLVFEKRYNSRDKDGIMITDLVLIGKLI